MVNWVAVQAIANSVLVITSGGAIGYAGLQIANERKYRSVSNLEKQLSCFLSEPFALARKQLAMDRVNADGFTVASTLGRHTNDKMVSFYVRAPGDWDIEFGTDGMRVDETHYSAEEITADSYWGHQWVGEMPAAMRL